MIITKKAIPRRTMLRGIGATLALPLLDGMIPALSALQKTAVNPVRRFGADIRFRAAARRMACHSRAATQ